MAATTTFDSDNHSHLTANKPRTILILGALYAVIAGFVAAIAFTISRAIASFPIYQSRGNTTVFDIINVNYGWAATITTFVLALVLLALLTFRSRQVIGLFALITAFVFVWAVMIPFASDTATGGKFLLAAINGLLILIVAGLLSTLARDQLEN